MNEEAVRRYFELSEKFGGSRSNWKYYFGILFENVKFEGANVLDIGGGFGRLSFYAAVMGANRVTLLEPEGDGSHSGMLRIAQQYEESISIQGVVKTIPLAFQDFLPEEKHRYDVVILERSINHLDEEACRLLNSSIDAKEIYVQLFGRIYEMMSEGGQLLIVDCSNRNLFGDLGITNPFASTINWEIHQSPYFWAEILESCGFKKVRINWLHHNRIRGIMRRIFASRLGAYLYQSMFLLEMKK